MKKKNIIAVMVVAMLLTVSLYFVGGTYARYATSFNGTAEAEIAKWAVALNKGGNASSFTTELKFTENANVVTGKIAPGVTASTEVEIKLQGTEVAVEIKADDVTEVVKNALSAIDIQDINDHDITVTASVDGGTLEVSGDGVSAPMVISLPDDGAQGFGADAIVKVKLEVKWANNDLHNVDHTKIGEKGGTLSIPIKFTAQQHID